MRSADTKKHLGGMTVLAIFQFDGKKAFRPYGFFIIWKSIIIPLKVSYAARGSGKLPRHLTNDIAPITRIMLGQA